MIRICRLNSTFINVPKTGSIAVRDFLLDNVFTAEDLCTRHKYKGQRFSQNVKDEHSGSSHVTVDYCIKNQLSPETDTFYLTIREPLERRLSFFLFRTEGKGTPTQFQKMIKENNGKFCKLTIRKLKPAFEWSQSSFALHPVANIVYWPYPYLQKNLYEFMDLNGLDIKTDLKRVNCNGKNTKELISKYYDKETILLTENLFREDFELYEKIMGEYKGVLR
jgi:hypothetical protein